MYQTKQSSLYEVIGRVKDDGREYFWGTCQSCGAPTCSAVKEQTVCDTCKNHTPTLQNEKRLMTFTELFDTDIMAEAEQIRICNEMLGEMSPKMEALQIAVVIGAVAVELDPRTPEQVGMDEDAADLLATQENAR